jgi:hypothetical protein
MLTLQFVQYHEIESLDSGERIKKLLEYVREDKIVVLEGRLKRYEEAQLIQKTMETISKKFKGIELAVIYPSKDDEALLKKLKNNLINILLGDRQGMTIIGPATVVKEIKQDPNKIQLLVNDTKKRKK